MSEVMLHGVLNMPVEMWHKDSPIDDIQRQSRYFEASKLIYRQADKIAELENAAKNSVATTLLNAMEESGVENFMCDVYSTDREDGKSIEITCRFLDGKSTAEVMKEMQARIAELEKERVKYIEICERHVSTRKYLESNIAELEEEHDGVVKVLKLIENSPFDIDGFPSAKEQVFNMQRLATETLNGNSFTLEAHNLRISANALSEYAYSNKPLTKRGLNLESIALTDKAELLKVGE